MSTAGRPKYLELSDRIESEIATGRWRRGRMPGLRELAAEYNVSVVTASRALHTLRDKGLIQSVHRSGNFLVDEAGRFGAPGQRGQRWGLAIRITPGPFQRASSSVTLAGFETVAARLNLTFVTDLFAIDDDAPPAELERETRRALESGIGGLFFLPSRISETSMRQDERILASCRAAGLPVVLIERNLRGDMRPLEWDLVATDDVEGGFRSTWHLVRSGRKRVAFVHASPTSTHNDRLAGYLLALHKASGGDDPGRFPPIVLEHRVDLPSKETHAQLAARLIELKVDGVVCYQDTVAIGLVLELLARRLRIPEDLALVGYDDLPIGNSFSLGLTTYALDAERIASEAVRVMTQRVKDPSASPIKVLVPGRLIVRESSPLAP